MKCIHCGNDKPNELYIWLQIPVCKDLSACLDRMLQNLVEVSKCSGSANLK